jgi:hypothetical protein
MTAANRPFTSARSGVNCRWLGYVKLINRLNSVATAIFFLVLIGSGRPEYPPPPGYVDACYGGQPSDDRPTARTEFVVRIQATEQQWPSLSDRLKKFGAEHGLAVFYTSMKLDWVHMVEVSLCSPEGLFVWADNRLYSDPMPNQDPNHVLGESLLRSLQLETDS